MRRGRNKQGRAAHSSCINRSIENLDYFARLHERSQTSGARVTAFSQVLADAGALTPADWKAAEGSHGRLIVSLVGAHGWAARALELDYEREDAREVFTGTCDLTDTLVNLMPAEEHKLLALAIIRADSLSLHARLLARVAIEIKAGGGSNSSGGSSRSGSGGSVTGRGATSAAITATQRAAVNIHVQLLVLNVALRMLRMLLSYRDTRVELRAALLRTQLFEHMSVALLSLAATMATIPGAAAGDATEVLAPMGASWGLLLTCASTVGQCISSTVVLLDQTAQEEGHVKRETLQRQPETVGGADPAPRQPQLERPELWQLLGGRCLQACAVWMARLVEATLREGSATGSAAAPGQAGAQDRLGHGAAGPAAVAWAPRAVAAAGGSGAPQRWRPEQAGDAVAVCRALVRAVVPHPTLVTQNTDNYIAPAAVVLVISARNCPFRLALTPPLRWDAKAEGAETGAGGVCAQEQQQQQQQQQQEPCAPDATAAIAGVATEAALGATGAAAAASAQLPAPVRSAGPEAAAVERTRAVNTYDVLFGAVDAVCAGRNTNVDLQDRNTIDSMRTPVALLVLLLCKLRPRQAAARLAGLWRVLLCELGATSSWNGAADVGLLLRLQLEEVPRSRTAAVAPASASPAASKAPAAVAATPHPAEEAFSPSFSLRCALAAGLLSRLEALLRNPQEEWPEAYATGGSSDHLLQLLLVDSGVWPLVLAHAPAVQVASLVATLTAAMRRLRHGHLSQAAAAEGRSSSRGGNASGSSSSGNGGGSSAAGTRPDTRAAVAGGNEAGAGTWWKGLVGLVERIVTFMEQSQRARFKLFCVEVTGGAPGTPGSQAQELASQQPQVPAQEQAQPQPQEQPPPQPPAQEQVPAPKTAAGVTAGGLCLRPSVYSPAAEQQRLLMSLCAWQWLPQVLFLARSYPLDNEGLWQYLQDMAAGQLSVAIVQALRAQQHAAGAAGGAGGADGADGKRDNSSSTTTTTTSSSSSLGTGCIPAAQAAESWRAFLYSQELDAEGFLAALLRHVGNPSCCIDSFWVAMLLAAIGAWDPGMLVRAAVAAAAADEGCGSSDGNGSSSISAAAVVSGARALVERAQREDNRWSRWPLPELFDFVAATVEQPSSAAGAGGVKTERLAAERPQPNGWRELQAVIMASFADVTALENLMSPAEVQARLHRLPVPVAAVVAGGTTAGSSTTGAAATAAATAEAGSGRGVVLCGNPACANTDGPSALFPAGGGKTCAR
ncbi:hypothetical protein CHLRE_14g629429v5 [Chlamydomonas reinhardtii]|uniref:phytol kinase n=1 Tax=Chlamydomonas reinhardtii TaxID=3055 RepID=A0A2K3CYK8_CHLRE|nr:uncharacterized protein CHLRE_14g629429v5 [Chlamydomonas reinhardtii]PNW73361.1 hypothetical protein CHLRE_14g629429v5 [Chlamydomonas reinhardtii]